MGLQYDRRGVPILSLREKTEALRYCIEQGQPEDAIGHICDLLNHVAPGYRFLSFETAAEIVAYYGAHPTPIEP